MPRAFDLSRLLPEGLPRTLAAPFTRLAEAPLGLSRLNRLIHDNQGASPGNFARTSLRFLGVHHNLPPRTHLDALAAIEGPVIVAANHPTGGTDAVALIDLLDQSVPGRWKILAIGLISELPPMAEVGIAVNPTGSDPAENRRALGAAMKQLKRNGVLAMFPAGRVSGWDRERNAPLDQPWREHLLRFARKARATVVLVHITGSTGPIFRRIPLSWVPIRTAGLARQIAYPHSTELTLSIARIVHPEELDRIDETELRASTYLERWQPPDDGEDPVAH